METNRVFPGQSQLPAQVNSPPPKDGEQAFHDLARSKGGTKEELAAATNERTRLTRTRKADRSEKKPSFLFAIGKDGEAEEIPIYYTVLDPTTGQIMTLRLLAVA